MSASRVIRWLNSGDWVGPLLFLLFGTGISFLIALFVAAARSGWPKDVPDALILASWPISALAFGAVALFFWQGWPRLTRWAEEREYRGHRESGQDSGSAARTIQAAINYAAGAEPTAGASLSPEPVAEESAIQVRAELHARWCRLWKRSDDEAERIRYVQ